MRQSTDSSNLEYWKRQAEIDDSELRAIQNAIKTSSVFLARFRIDALADMDFPMRDEIWRIGVAMCRDYLKISCYRSLYEKHCKATIDIDTIKKEYHKLVRMKATVKRAEAMFDNILAENSAHARKRRNAKRDKVALSLIRCKRHGNKV